MDDPHRLKLLLTRAADDIGVQFEAPPAEFFSGHRQQWQRANLKVAAAVLAVLALVVPVTLVVNSQAHNRSVAGMNPLPTMGSMTAASLARYTWSTLPTAPIASRSSAVGVWTGTQMVIWGGASGRDGAVLHADGAAYDPDSRTWSKLPPGPLTARAQAASVWTGKSVFIWGGFVGDGATAASDGALYTPADQTWRQVPTARVTAHGAVRAFWTGSVVVLLSTPPWAGKGTDPGANDGSDQVNAQSYNPATGSWTRLPDLRLHSGHTADVVIDVGAGNRIYVWSLWSHNTPTGPGSFATTAGVDGYTLEVDKRRWVSNTLALPDHAVSSSPLWTGRDIAMPAISTWFGAASRGPAPMNLAGVMLDPSTSSTRPIVHGAVDDLGAQYLWTGAALLGFNTGTDTSDAHGPVHPGRAAAWDPTSNTWKRLPDAPLFGNELVTVWTGRELLMWGQLFTPRGAKRVATTGLEFAP